MTDYAVNMQLELICAFIVRRISLTMLESRQTVETQTSELPTRIKARPE